MSSAMFHLCTARAFKPDAKTLFYIGNIAPDCRDIREIKDKTHFRDLERGERLGALCAMRDRLIKNDARLEDDFNIGILLHLFLDLKWDSLITDDKTMRDIFFADGVFRFTEYRREISLASGYLYRKNEWSDDLWSAMEAYDTSLYNISADFPAEAINAYLKRNHRWHAEHQYEAPGVFSAELIYSFCKKTAEEFRGWINTVRRY